MKLISLTFPLAAALAVRAQELETGALGNAVVASNNPVGVVYTASLPVTQAFKPEAGRGSVQGVISATAGPNGVGVSYNITISNLPTSGGPFPYHLHVAPVPEDGNCTKTLAHLDPFVRGEATPCNKAHPETCQVGDLSGKFGAITSDPFTASYTDLYSSTEEGLGAFFGNRSIVIHFANKTRISCANFAKHGPVHVGGNGTSGGAAPTGYVPTNPSSTPSPIPISFEGNGYASIPMAPMLPLFLVAGLAFFL